MCSKRDAMPVDKDKKVSQLLKKYFSEEEEFKPGETPVKLSVPTFGEEEVLEAMESLLSTWVTMGDKVQRFEEKWANYIGTSYATMVNSGSSANLLAFKSLSDKIEEGSEVIVPAVSWSTSVFPVLDVNAKPVFVDVEKDNFTIDPDAFQEAVTENTSAVVPIHLLGNPAEMRPIMEICEDEDIAIIEDCCEAHGAEYEGQPVGSFGDVGTYSFFFSHHISTIEGGMTNTNSSDTDERLRMLRAHGWTRDVKEAEAYTQEYPDIDPRFLFASVGYNLRPTEIQGAFGIHQIEKLHSFVEKRRKNADYLNQRLQPYSDYFQLFSGREDSRCSWFAYPLLIKEDAPFNRREFQDYLEERKIETRPILAGDITKQPVMKKIPHRKHNLSNSGKIHENGLFIGNHHKLSRDKKDYIVRTIREFIENR